MAALPGNCLHRGGVSLAHLRSAMRVVFVRRGSPAYNKVWITRDDGTTVEATIHVRNELRHLVVESLYGLDDGVWGCLAVDGRQPGLTDGYWVARVLTNLTHDKHGDGLQAPGQLRALVAAGWPSDNGGRLGSGPEQRSRVWSLARTRVAAVDDEAIELAMAGVPRLLGLWEEMAEGSSLKLEWPLPRSFFRRQASVS